jgi:hypothetical protein
LVDDPKSGGVIQPRWITWSRSKMDGKARVRLMAGRLAAIGSRTQKGDFGEQRAREWFARQGLDYFYWPQARETMPRRLAQMGGKRPDFAVDFGDALVYIDAKYHLTNGQTEFALENDELHKLSVFRDWVLDEYNDEGPRDVVFMLYPIELSGERFVLIHLDEMLSGAPTRIREAAGRKVSLMDRAETWFDQCPPPQH